VWKRRVAHADLKVQRPERDVETCNDGMKVCWASSERQAGRPIAHKTETPAMCAGVGGFPRERVNMSGSHERKTLPEGASLAMETRASAVEASRLKGGCSQDWLPH
jgi:hypothetical protein